MLWSGYACLIDEESLIRKTISCNCNNQVVEGQVSSHPYGKGTKKVRLYYIELFDREFSIIGSKEINDSSYLK